MQLGYLLVIPKTDVEGREEWVAEMGLSLVVRLSISTRFSCGGLLWPTVVFLQFETGNLAHFKSERMRGISSLLHTDTL